MCCAATESLPPPSASISEAVRGEQDIVEKIKAGEVAMVINTPYGNSGPRVDG